MTNKILATSIVGAVLALMLVSPNLVFADSNTNKGSTPNGKPFQYVQGQISDIQSQIDALKAKVTTIEGELAADNQAITLLQNDIANLNSQISTLESQSGDNSQAIQVLQFEIFQDQSQIAHLQGEIYGINTELQYKQNIINGVCPQGTAVVSIDHNGGLVCGNIVGSLHSATVYKNADVAPLSSGGVIAECPAGYTLSGGGFINSVAIIEDSVPSPFNANEWLVGVINPLPAPVTITAFADCLQVK